MKIWQAASALIGASVLLVVGLLFLDHRHQSVEAADNEKAAIELMVAQTASAIQSGVTANQLQLIQIELDDVNARIGTKSERPEDKSRKVTLEARIKKLISK